MFLATALCMPVKGLVVPRSSDTVVAPAVAPASCLALAAATCSLGAAACEGWGCAGAGAGADGAAGGAAGAAAEVTWPAGSAGLSGMRQDEARA